MNLGEFLSRLLGLPESNSTQPTHRKRIRYRTRGGRYDDYVITDFFFDTKASRSGGTYSPDAGTVNSLLKETWNPAGIRMLGFVHSHPFGVRNLSSGDLIYARAILEKIADNGTPRVRRVLQLLGVIEAAVPRLIGGRHVDAMFS